MSRLIDADELERRIREAEKIFYDIEDVGIAIDCIDATKTISKWHYPSKGEMPTEQNYYFVAVKPSFEGADMIVSLYTYFPREEKWIDKWGYSVREVYAWMPLPEPPKEEA